MKKRLLKIATLMIATTIISSPLAVMAAEMDKEIIEEDVDEIEPQAEEEVPNGEQEEIPAPIEEEIVPEEDGSIVPSDSYIGMNICDIDLPDDFIVNFEFTEDIEMADIVMDQYVDDEGYTVLVVGTLDSDAILGVAAKANLLSPFGLAPAPDNYDSNVMGVNWGSVPAVYEYNWDNSMNCWEYGVWINGVCYKTPYGTYNTDVRNRIQMYSDGSNVYMRIIFAREFGVGQIANSNDYNFYFDGNYVAKFQIADMTGASFAPGEYYHFKLAHADSGLSGKIAPEAEAIYRVTDDMVNNELFLKIPFSALEDQSGRRLEGVQQIAFYTPNLMQNKMYCAGSSTGGNLLVAGLFIVVCGSFAIKGKELLKNGNSSEL